MLALLRQDVVRSLLVILEAKIASSWLLQAPPHENWEVASDVGVEILPRSICVLEIFPS